MAPKLAPSFMGSSMMVTMQVERAGADEVVVRLTYDEALLLSVSSAGGRTVASNVPLRSPILQNPCF